MHYRLRDIILAGTILSLTGWVFIPIILILAFTQERIFFVQERIGLNDKPFKLIKFSTLRDILPGEKEEDNQMARLTAAGRWLRKLSLDELPQLFNVLKGEMSLVGPRPLLPEYLPLYTEEERMRHSVKPGITGWAQINGRNSIPFKERFKLDLWYIRNRSMTLDLKILFRTLGNIFRNEDVYVDNSTTSPKFDGTN